MPAHSSAVLTVHGNLNALCLFIRHLSASLDKAKDIPFGVKNSLWTSRIFDSDIDGFYDVNDGDLTYRLYMIQ
jgi:hypothetical protein